MEKYKLKKMYVQIQSLQKGLVSYRQLLGPKSSTNRSEIFNEHESVYICLEIPIFFPSRNSISYHSFDTFMKPIFFSIFQY